MVGLVCSCAKGEVRGLGVVTAATGGFKFCGELFLDKKSLNESDSADVRREAGD